ncbi:phosphoglycerate mutase family protein [Pochonia chlamydosporia 170]|uniref:Phosphoglycerate mutase family protein n=1 Tax=Pochonia chlamydosporia 170 TaxID=1380566 RepID=A0A179FVI6_METCM|nr:phosphoglycerate mutase family protein [Pochonia chlamydosporia 170]OAQ69624.1 phosphoglycerate mutase family protein [Pochonia chlamydosporia 170]
MHLLLVRHGESVDNAAGLYGGSRDAALTAHGVLQAHRFASSLIQSRLEVKHVFASNLVRAAKTAEVICDSQNKVHQSALTVVQLAELREKHFGNWEGVKFSPAPSYERPVQTGAETLESLKARTNAFLEKHLAPALSQPALGSDKYCVVVVSHGITLGVLISTLLKKLAVCGDHGSTSPGLHQLTSTRISWSNTGYLHLVVTPSNATAAGAAVGQSPWSRVQLGVSQINCTTHLVGLRKTRGGIGSAAHDEKQKTLDGFLVPSRKRRAEDDAN